MPAYWLIKSEPSVYSFAQLQKDRQTAWTGVRNFEARNHLRAMNVGDFCLYYHSGEDKAIVGLAKVVSEGRADETALGEDWAALDVAPVKAFKTPVTLAKVKATPAFKKFPLVTRSRLSVAKVTKEDFDRVVKLGGG